MGSVQIVSAFQTVVRASNQLTTAVWQYYSAHREAARDWTIQSGIDEAGKEGGASDGAEA